MKSRARYTRWAVGAVLGAACVAPAGFGGEAAGAGASVHRNVDYDLGSPPRHPSAPHMNRLDLYVPRGAARSARPVVVWIHGGGWRQGDKRHRIRKKARLFTAAGYVLASINYRLSAAPFNPRNPDPRRVMFPAHPRDVGEAIGWLNRNVAAYGGDPSRIVLIGHSAGAHLASLVATDPRYTRAYGVRPQELVGWVSLDNPTFEIASLADPSSRYDDAEGRMRFWNAFGTPRENEASGAWERGSPLHFADPLDPPGLIVTQDGNRQRAEDTRRMALALGRDPDEAVLALALNHIQISTRLGARGDASGLTAGVLSFVREAIAAAGGPRTRLAGRPARVVRGAGGATRVRFGFRSTAAARGFQCQLDGSRFRPCRSPRAYRVRAGRHTFAVRALAADGSPGQVTSFEFRVTR